MSKYILDYFNNEDLKLICINLVEKIENLKNLEGTQNDDIGLVDYNYNIKDGVMQSVSSEYEPNTQMSFDLDPDTTAHGFLKAMYASELSQEEEKQLGSFIQLICEKLEAEYISEIRETIRVAILHNSSEQAIPLHTIKIVNLDIVDFSSIDQDSRYTHQFYKTDDCEQLDQQAIQSRILEIRENSPDKPVEQIVAEEQEAGNRSFLGIEKVSKGMKYLWDVGLSLSVDYSFSEEFIASVQSVKNGG